MDVQILLERERRAVEAALERVVPAEGSWPARLTAAMRHAVLGGGKRLRPILARLGCAAVGGDPDRVTDAACGIELVHTYSLVHDDLPAMDDDLLRRGRPTVHAAFDEATAILAGDALLTEGLRLVSTLPEGAAFASVRAEAVAILAAASGFLGMVGGQMEDLEAGGQVPARSVEDAATRLERIHRHKTGRLISASLELGALWGGADEASRRRLAAWGERLGLAFQIADDILDATATAAELGKSPGKDVEAGKLTYVTLYGLEAASAKLTGLERELVEEAVSIEGEDGTLAALARWVACRRS